MKNYYIELEPLEKKETTGYSGPDMVCAHFRSKHEPSTRPFVWDMQCAIDFYYNQNKRYWNGLVIREEHHGSHKGPSSPLLKFILCDETKTRMEETEQPHKDLKKMQAYGMQAESTAPVHIECQTLHAGETRDISGYMTFS